MLSNFTERGKRALQRNGRRDEPKDQNQTELELARSRERELELLVKLRERELELARLQDRDRERKHELELARLQSGAASALPASSLPAEPDTSLQASAKTKSFDELQAKLSFLQICSPSNGGASSSSDARGTFDHGLAKFWTDGKTFLVKTALEPKDMAWASQESQSPPQPFRPDLFDKGNFYGIATSFYPSWSEVKPRLLQSDQNASSIFSASLSSKRVGLPWACKPELFAKAKSGHPEFNGELKSTCTKSVFEQVATYVRLDITQSLFCGSKREGKTKGFFYDTPPIGYGLVAFPHIGYFVALEWVGILHMTPITQPFFLGSDRHWTAVTSLSDFEYKAHLDADTLSFTEIETAPHKGISKDHSKQLFHKVIFAGTQETNAEFFRNLYHVYSKYSNLSAGERPSTLLPAKLLFGQDAVMVEMPLFVGRHAKSKELREEHSVSRAVAETIVWLATHGLLYVDIRCPNVLVGEEDRVALVDYDDMRIVDPISDFSVLNQLMNEQKSRGWMESSVIREYAKECFARL